MTPPRRGRGLACGIDAGTYVTHVADVTVDRATGAAQVERVAYTHALPRFSWLPAIETVLVPNDDLAPQGGGEPAIIDMGAVVANAILDAHIAALCVEHGVSQLWTLDRDFARLPGLVVANPFKAA